MPLDEMRLNSLGMMMSMSSAVTIDCIPTLVSQRSQSTSICWSKYVGDHFALSQPHWCTLHWHCSINWNI